MQLLDHALPPQILPVFPVRSRLVTLCSMPSRLTLSLDSLQATGLQSQGKHY